MRIIAIVLTLGMGFANDQQPANLIKCPDCGKDVSRRAVYCPACGCPGEAIADEVNKIQDARTPKPVVSIVASSGGGFGVAVEQGGKFVITRLESIGTGESLSIKSLTGQDVPYSAVEVAQGLPLVRLTVQGDAVMFLPASTTGVQAGFLNASGHHSGGTPGACAAIDAAQAVSALIDPKTGQTTPIAGSIQWVAIQPADFRNQVGLLAQAVTESAAGGLNPETRTKLSNTRWASQYFQSQAEQLLNKKP